MCLPDLKDMVNNNGNQQNHFKAFRLNTTLECLKKIIFKKLKINNKNYEIRVTTKVELVLS